MRNTSVIFWIWVSASGDVVKKISHLELWQSCLMQQNHLCNFERGHHWGKFMCRWNLDQWFKRKCRLKTFLI